jgi:hypothetical protein
MAAITTIPDFFPTEFSTNWNHLVQQKQSRLKEFVTLDTISGKEKSYNQMAATSMRLITGRAEKTSAQNTGTAKRWVREQGYDAVDVLDEFDDDLLGTIALPTSPLINNHAMAYMRTCDQVIIDALGGDAYSGPTGVTATPFNPAQAVAVNFVAAGSPANSGLTLAKVIEAKSLFGRNDVDEDEELIFVYSQKQLDDLLLNVAEVKSSDFANVKALIDGTIDRWMGFKWRRSQRLPLNTSTDVRTCYAYAKSGVVLTDAGRKVYTDILPTQNHALQIRSVARLGATRLEETKVVSIACDQSPA